MPPLAFAAADTGLLVIDMQTKLLAALPDGPRLVREAGFLLDAAKLVGVTTVATEQYPQGLGPTAAELLPRLGDRPAKVEFSACAARGVVLEFQRSRRVNVIVCGIETHVCVLHTVRDLMAAGFRVAVAADAVGSRHRIDHDIALRRMEQAGATLTTAETAAFEWLGGAAHPQFKAVSALVKARDLALRAAAR